MARLAKGLKIGNRTSRLDLPARREPYWVPITKGHYLGYRRAEKAGTWIARRRTDDGKQSYKALGAADDHLEAAFDGPVLTYAEAHKAASDWFSNSSDTPLDGARGAYTVRAALADYLKAYEARGGKAAKKVEAVISFSILPALGGIPVGKLTKRRVQSWFDEIASSMPSVRGKKGGPAKVRKPRVDPEAQRRRRSTANRILTVLKAALNHAHAERRVASKSAWESVRPFRAVDAARVRFLDDDEAVRLTRACSDEFRPMVQAALLTGARYGELCRLRVADIANGSIQVRMSKGGKPRHIFLTTEGTQLFQDATLGKSPDAWVFSKSSGAPWGASHQARPFRDAVKRAGLGSLSFHELRHTYASRLIMRGVPLAVVAEQLGHADTRMVSKHYGHLAPSFVADSIRAAWGTLGVFEPSTRITRMRTVSRNG